MFLSHFESIWIILIILTHCHYIFRLGSRAALSFAFAFLRRAWRSGEDGDLCTDLLEETLDALRLLPPASLFDESTVSSVWLEVVERTSKFLRSVVQGQMDSVEVPLKDRHTALTLLLELALQRGSLHELLKMVKLLLDLWSLGQRSRQDNRAGLRDSCAPIIPFLKRFEGNFVYTCLFLFLLVYFCFYLSIFV